MCLVAAFGVACSQPSSEEAEMDFCTALAAVGTAIDQLQAIGPTSTIEEYNTAQSALDASLANARTAAGDVAAARAAELDAAVETFRSNVGTISDDTTLAGSAATVSASATVLRSSYDTIYAAENCATP
jgi:hypothetical protein